MRTEAAARVTHDPSSADRATWPRVFFKRCAASFSVFDCLSLLTTAPTAAVTNVSTAAGSSGIEAAIARIDRSLERNRS